MRGLPVGINHSHGQNGTHRYKTTAARDWERAVEESITYAARYAGLLGADAWGVDDSLRGAPRLEIVLHFVYAAQRNRSRPDADAAQKLTIDAIARGLALDDRVVKQVSSALTINATPTASTEAGCLISVRRLSLQECAALDDEVAQASASDLFHRLQATQAQATSATPRR